MVETIFTFRQVSLEDFDVQMLLQLAREGRLYYDPNEPSESIQEEDRQQEILKYISEIENW